MLRYPRAVTARSVRLRAAAFFVCPCNDIGFVRDAAGRGLEYVWNVVPFSDTMIRRKTKDYSTSRFRRLVASTLKRCDQ
jgi:hypothetical protein